MASAWTAQTGADLEVLVRDLPALPRSSRPSPRPPAGSRPRLDLDGPVRTYLVVMALLWLIWLVTGGRLPLADLAHAGWGIGVAGHAGRAWTVR